VAGAFLVVAHLFDASRLPGLTESLHEVRLFRPQFLREVFACELILLEALGCLNYLVRRNRFGLVFGAWYAGLG
jgi:hypothetical protein